MAKLKGNGVPTRKTTGALGDIYTDVTTGKQYKCVFSYRDAASEEYDTQWKNVGMVEPEVEEEVKESDVVEEPAVEEDPKPEPKKAANQKTNYAAYSKKGK